MPFKMLEVKSSNIFAIGYDLGSRKARVTFKRGGAPTDTYEYAEVDTISICELLFADSIGSHFSKVFKVKFTDYRKLTPDEVAA